VLKQLLRKTAPARQHPDPRTWHAGGDAGSGPTRRKLRQRDVPHPSLAHALLGSRKSAPHTSGFVYLVQWANTQIRRVQWPQLGRHTRTNPGLSERLLSAPHKSGFARRRLFSPTTKRAPPRGCPRLAMSGWLTGPSRRWRTRPCPGRHRRTSSCSRSQRGCGHRT